MRVRLLLPYSMGAEAAMLRQDGEVYAEDYGPDGLTLDVCASIRLLNRFKDYMI